MSASRDQYICLFGVSSELWRVPGIEQNGSEVEGSLVRTYSFEVAVYYAMSGNNEALQPPRGAFNAILGR